MRRLLTLVFLAAVAVPAAGQENPRPMRPSRDSTVVRRYGDRGSVQIFGMRRGRLGVAVNLLADPARDTIGAVIGGVTPGGPADKAGVQEGDIVVSLNGTRLARGSGGDNDGEDDAGRPGQRLVEEASRLHTGDTVHLELRRDGKPVNLTLIAGSSGMEGMVRSLTLQPSRQPLTIQPFVGENLNLTFDGAPLANLELVRVNPGLAAYFGTSEGILVVDAPGDSTLGLKAGDVILSIGGRKPTSPSHAFRILGTYDAGEAVGFELMRMKHRISVSGKMPERRGWSVMPDMYENFDGLVDPGWEHMDLLRGWSGTEWPQELEMPDVQIFKDVPHKLIRLEPKHRTVST